MQSSKILVYAGTIEQAQYWARYCQLGDFTYVTGSRHLLGHSGAKLYLAGLFYERSDYSELVKKLYTSPFLRRNSAYVILDNGKTIKPLSKDELKKQYDHFFDRKGKRR